MKKARCFTCLIAALALLATLPAVLGGSVVGCGGASIRGAGGGGGGGETPTGGIVDETGASITSVDTNDAVNLSVSGLTADTQYTITVTDASGTELSPSGGFVATTDEDGNIPTSTIIADLSEPASGSGLVLWSQGFVPRPKAITGDLTILIKNPNGDTVLTKILSVVDRSKVFCADSSGVGRASFLPSETVYAKVEKGASGTLADGTYTCHVISDLHTQLVEGDSLAGTSVSVTVTSGTGLVALGTFSSGQYDVVCDVNGNGTYERGTDLNSRPRRFDACFTIQSANSGNDIIGQICSDRNGNYHDVFDPNATDPSVRDVWAWISPPEKSLVQHATGVCKYVVDHQATWTNGDALTDVDAKIEKDPVRGWCTNELPYLIWPRRNLVAGCYDCIIDVNCNGVYDKGTDFVDNIDNSGDNTVGGMCVSDSGCNIISITSHSDGDTVSSSAITLTGTVTGSVQSGKLIYTSGESSNEIDNITIDSTGAFSIPFDLFPGENIITGSVTKTDGTVCTKTIKITSTASAGEDRAFQTQLTWDGSTDMDLHLVKPNGSYANGGGGTGDCNYSNCKVGLSGTETNSIDWGVSGEADDPKLDVDCIACGNGIENIWLDQIPEAGDYKVYVDAFSGTETEVTVSIFVDGARIDQVVCGDMSSGTATDSCFAGTWNSTSGNWTRSGTKASTF